MTQISLLRETAKVTCFIWGGGLDPTGHASLEIACDGEDEHGRVERVVQYLSFHPVGTELFDLAGQMASKTYDGRVSEKADDEKAHKGRCEKVVVRNAGNLWIADMMNRIDEIKRRPPKYNLYLCNCSTLVMEVLMKGLHKPFQPSKSLSDLATTVRLFKPGSHTRILESFREALELYLGLKGRQTFLSALGRRLAIPALIVDIATRVFTWTPGDVKAFAEDMG